MVKYGLSPREIQRARAKHYPIPKMICILDCLVFVCGTYALIAGIWV